MAIEQVRIARSPRDGTLLSAYVQTTYLGPGASRYRYDLKVDRYDDADPPAVTETVTVVTGIYETPWTDYLARGSDLCATTDGTWWLLSAEAVILGGTHYYCYLRRSVDGGRTWSDPQAVLELRNDLVTSTPGYIEDGVWHAGMENVNMFECALAVDSRSGLLVAMPRVDLEDYNQSWLRHWAYLYWVYRPATMNASGIWTFTDASVRLFGWERQQPQYTLQREGPSLCVRRARYLEMSGRDSNSYQNISSRERVPGMTASNPVFVAGTEDSNIAGDYRMICHALSPDESLKAFALWQDTLNRWEIAAGAMNDASPPKFQLSTPAQLVAAAGCIDAPGSLLCRRDGVWEFAYVVTGGASYAILRCKDLSATGAGTWS